MTETQPTKNGMAITALVLGIIALLGSWMPIINNLSAMLAVLGVIFGIVGLLKIKKANGVKTFSVVALTINVIAFAIVLSTQSMYSKALDNAANGAQAAAGTQTTDLAVGQSATLDNGLVVTVTEIERGVTQDYIKGKFAAVNVTIENKGKDKTAVNPLEWKSINADGVEQDQEFVAPTDGRLESADLHPGGKISGKVYFKDDITKVAYVTGLNGTVAASWNLN